MRVPKKCNLNLRLFCLTIGFAILFSTASSKIPDKDAKFTDEEEGSNYPKEVFTAEYIWYGGWILYIIGIFYMFLALAVVCDDYFVPSL